MNLRRLAHRLLFQLPRAAAALPRRRSGSTRSLWAGPAIHTLATKARAERLTGVDAESLTLQRFSTRADFTYDLTRWSAMPVLGKVLPYVVLAWALRRFDRFHFFYNRGVLAQIEPGRFNLDELDLLRGAGAQVFFWAYGADVRGRERTMALGEPNCCSECPAIGELCVCDDRLSSQNYRDIRTRASGCATMGDMRPYTPGADDRVFYWPVDLDDEGGSLFEATEPPQRDTVVVAHAPNNRELKGTRHLERAVQTLRDEGIAVTLDLVSGVSNREVLDRFRDADVVFDQCMIGFHGYTALEAMAIERPVVCFLRDPGLDLVAPEECPIVNAHPSELVSALRTLCNDEALRRRLGTQGRRYVATHHSLDAVGRRIQAFVNASLSETKEGNS